MNLPGTRVVKTAVAVFITAYICQLLKIPAAFAVITAIVTLEPTVSDSIKKGLVRFPASAIGSFFAVLFIALFGNSPITFTLAAALTIIICYQLKLHDGLLVATITAVAMIDVVYGNYLLSFFTRLGTTTIGIVVSTLVNLFIFPPKFMNNINENILMIKNNIGNVLLGLVNEDKDLIKTALDELDKTMTRTEALISHQRKEEQFHPLEDNSQKKFINAQKNMNFYRQIQYHLHNIENIEITDVNLREQDKSIITSSITYLEKFLMNEPKFSLDDDKRKLLNLLDEYWSSTHERSSYILNKNELPDELILLYELISLYELFEGLIYIDEK